MPLQPMITGARHMISAGHYLAAEAGYAVLRAGGNVVDAGVAAGIALGVVHSDQVQFSGVAPMMIHLADRDETITIAGLGGWPRAARIETFVEEHGGAIPVGLLRTVVPAAPATWIRALELYGTMSFSDVAEGAVHFARDGFAMYPTMSDVITMYEEDYRRWPSTSAIYLPNGRPPRVGDLFVQSDLARSLQYMCDQEKAHSGKGRLAGLQAARDAFYTGDLAATIARFHKENGGWLTMGDLAGFEVDPERPVSVDYKDYTVYTCPAWCQGPVLGQALKLVEGIDLRALGHNAPEYAHLVIEALKLVFADRERYYGDPKFVDVPLSRLLSDAYAAERRAAIRSDRAYPGMPPAGDGSRPKWMQTSEETRSQLDTSYVCVIDRHGNVFSATPSDTSNESPVIPGTGLVPSMRGTQSWTEADHASVVAPGKRPRLTPNPAFALGRRGRLGRELLPFGTPGGDVQIQAMLQTFLNMVEFGMNPQQAVEAPRFATQSFPDSFQPHAYQPNRLMLESRLPQAVGEHLSAVGHDVQWWPQFIWRAGGMCAIRKDPDSGMMFAGADPRRACYALGW